MFYSGDKTADIQTIAGCYWEHYKKFGMDPEHRGKTREPTIRVVDDMYDNFPGKRENASPFKLAAWFAICFLFHRPLSEPFKKSITSFPDEQNAIVAYNILFIALKGCRIFLPNEEERVIWDYPDKFLSRHSYNDIIGLLLEWEDILKQYEKMQDDDVRPLLSSFYRSLAVLVEQITYRAFPALSYPPYMSNGKPALRSK